MHNVEFPCLEGYATDHLSELRRAAEAAKQAKALEGRSEWFVFGRLAAQAGKVLASLGNRLERYGRSPVRATH